MSKPEFYNGNQIPACGLELSKGEMLSRQITNYLASGGLFNPELMEADKVRDLLMECREYFDARLGITKQCVIYKEEAEVQKIKADILYEALDRAGAPLAGVYPSHLYAWADNVKQNPELSGAQRPDQ